MTESSSGPAVLTLASKVLALLEEHGAMFTSDLEQESGLLRPQLEQALKSLIATLACTWERKNHLMMNN